MLSNDFIIKLDIINKKDIWEIFTYLEIRQHINKSLIG